MRILHIFFFLLPLTQINSQDTLRIVYYNLLNFPISQPDRIDTLKKITEYIKPDVFVVNELTSYSGAVQIKSNALNVGGVNYYEQAIFYDGPDTDNLLYYNSNKLGLISQNQIPTVLRDISEYVMYYKEPGMTALSDTTYLYFYSLHLKAGSQQSEMDQRYIEAQALKDYLDNNNRTDNLFVGGDFNIYHHAELGCQEIISGGMVHLNDPINKMGNWHAEIGYKAYHTQSTRMNQGYAGGSNGGMDDRFDFIFVSDDILTGASGVQYLTNTYKAIGQDGQHFNSDIHIPFNSSVPSSISNALFYMSDHLPVLMEVILGGDVNVAGYNNLISNAYVNSENNLNINLNSHVNQLEIKILDMSGRLVLNNNYFSNSEFKLQLDFLPSGIYITRLLADGIQSTFKFVIINK